MKKCTVYPVSGCVIVLLCICAFTGHAPLVTYVTVNDGTARCQFRFPNNYEQQNETEATMYSAIGDDNITYEMHYRNTTTVESIPGQNFQNQINSVSQSYKLQQFANTLAQATGGQIVSQIAITEEGQEGREIELDFTDEGDTWKMYARFFWHNNTIYAFTIASVYNANSTSAPKGPSTNAVTISDFAAARSQYFGSIDFY